MDTFLFFFFALFLNKMIRKLSGKLTFLLIHHLWQTMRQIRILFLFCFVYLPQLET